MLLTKSNYMSYCQCPKRLWLDKNRPDLRPAQLDPMTEKIFEEAKLIEAYALELYPGCQQAFPDREEASSRGGGRRPNSFGAALQMTSRLVGRAAGPIYQPSFMVDGLFCRCDIIVPKAGGGWDLIEVKSSTSAKEEHLLDLAFQRLVLERSGLEIKRLKVIHVNSEYVRKGPVRGKQLLTEVDVTEEADAVAPSVLEQIDPAKFVMGQSEEPEVSILNQCYRPRECSFVGYCRQGIPEHSIYGLGFDDEKLQAMLDRGIVSLEDVPEEKVTAERKLAYYRALKSGKPVIDRDKIGQWLSRLAYPLYHLDYETYASAVPMFDGYRPYQQVPFQYSLHFQESLGAEMRHCEYLSDTWDDPVPGLAESLAADLGPEGTVLAWYQDFESGRNREMGERMPALAGFFQGVNDRMMDLMDPFRNGWYVDGRFRASASLKAVLPVLAPDLSYDSLEIGNGAVATVAWRRMIDRTTAPDEAARIKAGLLEYCGQDTWAMVRILEVLQSA